MINHPKSLESCHFMQGFNGLKCFPRNRTHDCAPKHEIMCSTYRHKAPWTPYGYRWNPYFWGFWTFMKPVSFINANSSFKNKNCYNKVTLYPMDLTWKIFFCSKKTKFSNFHFLNLSPAVPNFGASYLPRSSWKPAEILGKWLFQL